MNRRIFVLRHGETYFNVEQKLQGHCNSPLTPRGRAQAEAMGKALAGLIDLKHLVLFASPLGRALQTAEIVCAELGIVASRIIRDERLMEFNLGLWEQRTVPALKSQHPELLDARDWYLHAPEGESFGEVRSRLESWLNELPPEGDILVVSHALTGAVLRGMLQQFNYDDTWQQDLPQDAFYWFEEGAVHRVDCSGALAAS
ncbi:phosphoglycerate mutase family protein [Shewanella sp. JM162201]|uniref:Phosphoglycerate mutase family protein n=1 Tax=Shewanella jiangmenensis TaxID=2837387 RepID=A0ABS5V2Q2_9GAMM|nr:histidine phosphatase family protein [Shewanella jiangmenensis]MBT1444730.1 phosphoglycerate mutase family protein [Shewanella jiangmenensis]